MEPWRLKAPLRAASVLAQLAEYQKTWSSYAVLQLLLVYNNKLYWPQRTDAPATTEPTRYVMSEYNVYFHRAMTGALEEGRIQLPNCLLILNTDDNIVRFGRPDRNLSVPPLSVSKLGSGDLDILVPQMWYTTDSLHNVPWHLKKDIAFFRGRGHCSYLWFERYGFSDACPRIYLAYASERDRLAGNATALDVGLTAVFGHRHKVNASVPYEFVLPVLHGISMADHSQYRYLLNLEGFVAAFRLTQLMMLNSLILHQRTPCLEFFYRSLQEWKHYVPFWNSTSGSSSGAKLLGMDDVYLAVEAVRRMDREDPGAVQEIVANAQTFAIKFLQTGMRLEYYKAAFEAYKALFPDMDAFVEEYVQGLRAKGWKIT